MVGPQEREAADVHGRESWFISKRSRRDAERSVWNGRDVAQRTEVMGNGQTLLTEVNRNRRGNRTKSDENSKKNEKFEFEHRAKQTR
jgi:hypothetical protein